VFNFDISYMLSCSRNAQVTFSRFRALSCLHGGKLNITRTVPLNSPKLIINDYILKI